MKHLPRLLVKFEKINRIHALLKGFSYVVFKKFALALALPSDFLWGTQNVSPPSSPRISLSHN